MEQILNAFITILMRVSVTQTPHHPNKMYVGGFMHFLMLR